MRLRLREHSEVEHADTYETLDRDTFSMPDHVFRCFTTAGLAASVKPETLLDPACGDAVVPMLTHRLSPMTYMRLCDLSLPALTRIRDIKLRVLPASIDIDQADIEDVLTHDTRHYDMVVLTEILEHLEDPAYVLAHARERATYLVASSPVFDGPMAQDPGTEHVWQFDKQGYANLLNEGNWWPRSVIHLQNVNFFYQFQIWLCT